MWFRNWLSRKKFSRRISELNNAISNSYDVNETVIKVLFFEAKETILKFVSNNGNKQFSEENKRVVENIFFYLFYNKFFYKWDVREIIPELLLKDLFPFFRINNHRINPYSEFLQKLLAREGPFQSQVGLIIWKIKDLKNIWENSLAEEFFCSSCLPLHREDKEYFDTLVLDPKKISSLLKEATPEEKVEIKNLVQQQGIIISSKLNSRMEGCLYQVEVIKARYKLLEELKKQTEDFLQ